MIPLGLNASAFQLPISYADISLVGKSNTTYAARRLTNLTKPAGLLQNDYLLFYYIVGNSPAAAEPSSIPSGFTSLITPISVSSSGYVVKSYLFGKLAGSSEPSSWEVDAGVATYSTQGCLLALRNVNPVSPFDDTIKTNNGTGTVSTFLGLTTTTPKDWLIAFGHDWGDKTTDLMPPSGMTEEIDVAISYAADQALTTTGAVSNKIMTNNNISTEPWATIMLALKPKQN